MLDIDHEFSWDGGFLGLDANPFRKKKTADPAPSAARKAESNRSVQQLLKVESETTGTSLKTNRKRHSGMKSGKR